MTLRVLGDAEDVQVFTVGERRREKSSSRVGITFGCTVLPVWNHMKRMQTLRSMLEMGDRVSGSGVPMRAQVRQEEVGDQEVTEWEVCMHRICC